MPEATEATEKRGPSQATRLVELALERVELFRDGEAAYASITKSGRVETWAVKSTIFRNWLNGLYFTESGKAANGDSVGAAIATLTSFAIFKGKARRVFLRVAPFDEKIYIDLVNDQWQVIEVDGDGWRVIEASAAPVRFRRTKAMLPLPLPQKGGAAKDLRKYVNIATEDDFILVLAWLVAVLRGRGPFAILLFNGAKGSAKSTLLRVLRQLTDPNRAALRLKPTNERDFAVATRNCYLQTLENVSYVEPWLSDLLCVCSTGGAVTVRGLYTDDDEQIFELNCPVAITGITEVLTRDDAVDRSIGFILPEMTPEKRKTEEGFDADFYADAPKIFGALLNGVSCALRHYQNINLPTLPRLADFARWSAAAMPAFGYKADQFIQAYEKNRQDANKLVLEVSKIARHVIALAKAGVEPWSGTATDLLEKELNWRASDTEKKQKAFPKNGHALANQLRHIAGNLKQVGVLVDFGAREPGTGNRLIMIGRVDK